MLSRLSVWAASTKVTHLPVPLPLPLLRIAQPSKQVLFSIISSQTGGGNGYRKLKEEGGLAHGKEELPPLWVDIQESIEEKISRIDDLCKLLVRCVTFSL